MNYFDEYIKHKSKYLQLKETNNNDTTNITGGESYFHKFNQVLNGTKLVFKSFNIMTELDNNSLIVKFLEHAINDILLYKGVNKYIIGFDSNYKFHFTLLNFELNVSHPLNTMGNNCDFSKNNFAYAWKDNSGKNHKTITNKFESFIQKIDLYRKFREYFNNVVFKTSNFEILGTDTKYFVQKYTYDNINSITQFRTYFYSKLFDYIQDIDPTYTSFVFKFAKFNDDGTHYILSNSTSSEFDYVLYYPLKTSSGIISRDEHPLLAIPKYYWGRGVWSPHTSLFKLNNVSEDISESPFFNYNFKNILNYKNIEFTLRNTDISNVVCK